MTFTIGQSFNLTTETVIDKYRGYVSEKSGKYLVQSVGRTKIYLQCFETGHDLFCEKVALENAIETNTSVKC